MVEAYRDDKYQKNLDTAEREGKAMMAELGIARIDGLGIAFPGLVNPRDKVVVSANGKFVDAVGYDLKSWVARTFACPFILDNDANAALVGEVAYGCAQDTRDVVMMIFGTGVGAAAMMDGRLIRGKHFQAACIGGHMVIEAGPDATPCNCGNIGCMEANASSWRCPSSRARTRCSRRACSRASSPSTTRTSRPARTRATRSPRSSCSAPWTAGAPTSAT